MRLLTVFGSDHSAALHNAHTIDRITGARTRSNTIQFNICSRCGLQLITPENPVLIRGDYKAGEEIGETNQSDQLL